MTNGSRTLKDAISEAMRDWVTNVGDTYYLLGSALGSHPYPMMVRDFHKVIGEEARAQILEAEGRLPDARDRLRGRRQQCHRHLSRVHSRMPRWSWSASKPAAAATRSASMRRGIAAARPACCRAPTAIVLQDERRPDRADALGLGGLDYAMIGPEHAWLHDREPRRVRGGDATPKRWTRRDAVAHRGHHSGARIGACGGRSDPARARRRKGKIFIVNLSGRGDKDIDIYRENFKELDAAMTPNRGGSSKA